MAALMGVLKVEKMAEKMEPLGETLVDLKVYK